jgi:hypothetical protein
MRPPPGIDKRGGVLDVLDFGEIEQPFAVERVVQRVYAKWRMMGVGHTGFPDG